jgi:hypothetical protein
MNPIALRLHEIALTLEGTGQDEIVAAIEIAEREIIRQDELINNPHTDDFLEAVRLEAAHQRERWRSDHDAGKTDADWFWLIGYLAGKALHAGAQQPDAVNASTTPFTPIVTKQLHHIITTAAACLNWHAHRIGASTAMRPGIEPPKGEDT